MTPAVTPHVTQLMRCHDERKEAEVVERLLTVDDAAKLLAVSRWTVYRLIKERKVVSVLVGRCRRITSSSLAAYMDDLIEEVA